MERNKHSNIYAQIKSRALALAPYPVIFPFYHAISDHSCPHLKNLYRVEGVKTFEKNLDELLSFMTPLSTHDAIAKFNDTSFVKPFFHLSFDDGLREIKEVIAPMLLRKGIPATFFITSGFTNNKTLFHRHKVSLIIEKLRSFNSNSIHKEIGSVLNIPKIDTTSLQKAIFAINFQTAPLLDIIARFLNLDFVEFLKVEQPYLYASDIQDLDKNGFSIGLHSLNHPEFYLLNEPEMDYQVTESKRLLRELTGIESSLFSFPFTDSGIPDSFIKKMIADYQMITFGSAGIKNEPIKDHFQRIPMDARRSNSAISLVANEIMRYRLKFLFNMQKVKR